MNTPRDAVPHNVVFDIGWVLVHLAPAPLLTLLREHGAGVERLDEVTSRIDLHEHESGRLDGAGLLANIARLAPREPTAEAVAAAWIDMFDPQPAMFALAQRLRRRHRVYLLSNVGDLHWAELRRRFALHELGHDVITSFEAGVMKPYAGIYEQAERRFALQPESTVFIDDRAENVEAVRQRGWHGIIHVNHDRTVAALRALGVDPE
ncbi:MAG: HAD family phosphatase [Gammaproteobacteria bacterium]|jgi:HAD superfamily hydrolase (TIGR01509 family)|nr:HAD family phosphatase [Gammaproteobacteria bacterium]NBP07706.1 HAD family phosphatase [Gammaproteobacteria bacterium]NBR17095.1 HAD family phosphatase [Gammaproteobacteria bacterium]NCW20973.1 HAD family phosphatase [Gammaproteobacteria bacterium]NCW57047.1 HAD family phosphatase [Gammaproteobacteria bacterium]